MLPAARINRSLLAAFVLPTLFASAAVVLAADPPGPASEIQQAARRILHETGVTGGLIVHLDCNDGKLTAALRAGESYLVHGLDTDADQIRQAREYLHGLRTESGGVHGPVSVEQFDGRRLPYADNLVNLIVADDLGDVSTEEAMRVLAPGGTLYTGRDGRWEAAVKPWPSNIDEWTHFRHDADGNAVSHDEVVGPPGRIQWVAGPRHTRSHEHIPGVQALVSSGGRIFYIVDEGPIGALRPQSQWSLVARDAFNGTLLWRRQIETWFPHIVNWGQTPRQLQRKLVAVGDRVYVTLGLHAPLVAIDAATGKTVREYENTGGTEEIVLHRGVLLLALRSVTDQRRAELEKWAELLAQEKSPLDDRDSANPLVKRLRAVESQGEKAVVAIDADSGRPLWKATGPMVSALRVNTLSADGPRVFYQNGLDVKCLDLAGGEELWSTTSAPLRLVADGSVFCVGSKVEALSAETGQSQWKENAALVNIRDVFLAGGSLWIGGFKPIENKRSPVWGPYFVNQRDKDSGQILMRIEPQNPGHHHRCYENKATDRYILGGRRGTEFIDLNSGEVLWNSWARGVCKYGVMPANGLLYTPPHACACYPAAKLTGFHALAAGDGQTEGENDEPVVQRGPAFASDAPGDSTSNDSSAWPTYRADAQRSGRARSPVSAVLRQRWRANVGGRLTAPTIAEGRVCLASIDEHTVYGLEADSGQTSWRFTAGGRVDSPPSLHQGRAIFGCRDGYAYSLRASDGELAWRTQAAGKDRRITAYGRLESVSPAHGSVLILDEVVYLTAGRSSYTDGGIDLLRLDPNTGAALSRTSIHSPDPETGRQPPQSAPAVMPGARWDILSADDRRVYMRDMAFDHQGIAMAQSDNHLFTLTDFTDDSWAHRSYWIFGDHCSVATGCSRRDGDLVFGRMLAFDDSTIFGYGRRTVDWSNRLRDGPYRLFATGRGGGDELWSKPTSVQVRAMVLTDEVLFVAGPLAYANQWGDTRKEGRAALLLAVSTADGAELARYPLDAWPVFDGMAAAGGRLYISLANGQVVCMEGE